MVKDMEYETFKKRTQENIDDADFETAISNSKFGVFNYMLLFVSFFVALAPGFETTTMSYVGPASGCDLKINLNQKGLLNASTYIGMISSAFLWGYLSDISGRKKLLIYGLLMTILSDTLGSFSQNYIFLLTCRFLSGFAVCGPYAVLVTYLSELHSAKYRSKIIILFGAYISFSNLILPFIAWWIIPKDIQITAFNYFTLHSWNIFMIITPVPALISALAMLFFPESPKFLMSKGKNRKAISIFQYIFAKNTKLPQNVYPVKSLVDELSKRNSASMQTSKSGCSTHLKSLCFAPYISNLALILTIQFFTMLGANTLRLWLPQLFTAFDMHDIKNSNVSVNICSIIDDLAQKDIKNTTCSRVDDHMNGVVFKNSIIVAFCSAIGYLITVVIVNKFDKKNLMIFLFVCSALSGYGSYCSTSITTTLLFSSIYVTFTAICSTVILSFVVDLFPTYLRAMTVSLAMMSGRTGVIVGNFLFPLLLQTGCFPPFFMISFILIICAVLTFLLPATNMKSLQ